MDLGKQAKILAKADVARVLAMVDQGPMPTRNRVMVLLAVQAGLRASEIAGLTWDMVLDGTGSVYFSIEVRGSIAKRGRGRRIPMHSALRSALKAHLRSIPHPPPSTPVIASRRGGRLRPNSVVNWFIATFRAAGLRGCSSHSGRRTFITRAARCAHHVGASLRDVQMLAGHRSIETTQRYIDGDTDAQLNLVERIGR